MTWVKVKSMVATTLMTALFSTLAVGCYYYDRDDYERYADRRYSYRYDRERDRDYSRYRDRDLSDDRYYDRRYDQDRRYSRNNRFDSVPQYD
jgi:hypothetical protein